MASKHDVIVYGATGFTGGLVAQYLSTERRLAPERWALAGRDIAKLEAVRERLAARDSRLASLQLYQASSENYESLADMAVRTRVVLTTVGPYEKYGRPLVRACVQTGTDYVDLTGEPGFWQEMVDQHHVDAENNGAMIVSCCGFDSIPQDIGAWLVVHALHETAERTGKAIEVDGYIAAKGLPSGGTWQSAIDILADIDISALDVRFSDDVARWVLRMPSVDPMVVARSGELGQYGAGFRYTAWIEAKSRVQMGAMRAGIRAAKAAAKVGPLRKLMASLRPSGAGPSENQRAASWFRVKTVGRCGDAEATAVISGGDPGYDETAKMISESALCLATERDALPLSGGVVTPASAMGEALVGRLRDAGLKITVRGPDAEAKADADARPDAR